MAAIYKGECTSCGASSPISQEGYVACRLDNGEIKPLIHPVEFMMLEDLGITQEQAAKENRLLWVTNVVCNSCGHLAEKHEVSPNHSCLAFLVVFLISYILPIWLLPMPWGFFAGIIVFCALSWAMTSLQKLLVRDAQRLLPPPPVCPNCADSKYVPFTKIFNKKTVCQECGERSMEYEFFAIS